MCGIFGVITNRNDISIGKIALEGIKRLEYRGYDSCGIVAQSNSKIYVRKDAGKIDDIQKKINLAEFPNGSKLALAHTRWATYGAPTKENSHPHLDCKGKIAVVHNGIIDNFIELKEELTSRGHVFKSDTDTEVIPHLIEEYMMDNLDFRTAAIKALKEGAGHYSTSQGDAELIEAIVQRENKKNDWQTMTVV